MWKEVNYGLKIELFIVTCLRGIIWFVSYGSRGAIGDHTCPDKLALGGVSIWHVPMASTIFESGDRSTRGVTYSCRTSSVYFASLTKNLIIIIFFHLFAFLIIKKLNLALKCVPRPNSARVRESECVTGARAGRSEKSRLLRNCRQSPTDACHLSPRRPTRACLPGLSSHVRQWPFSITAFCLSLICSSFFSLCFVLRHSATRSPRWRSIPFSSSLSSSPRSAINPFTYLFPFDL